MSLPVFTCWGRGRKQGSAWEGGGKEDLELNLLWVLGCVRVAMLRDPADPTTQLTLLPSWPYYPVSECLGGDRWAPGELNIRCGKTKNNRELFWNKVLYAYLPHLTCIFWAYFPDFLSTTIFCLFCSLLSEQTANLQKKIFEANTEALQVHFEGERVVLRGDRAFVHRAFVQLKLQKSQ